MAQKTPQGRYSPKQFLPFASQAKFTATAYGPPWGGIQGSGVTATGVDLRKNPRQYIVATDPKVIPTGSLLKVDPNPFGNPNIIFRAADTGGAIKGKTIDFYDWRGRAAQNAFGRRSVEVTLLDPASAPATPSSSSAASPLIDPVPQATKVGGVHPTANLPGYPALDFLAPPGTSVFAPEPLTFERPSGRDPALGATSKHGAFGLSEYFKGLTTGADYFITHLGALGGFTPGQRVEQGTAIGTIGDFPDWTGTPDHAHIGVSGYDVTRLASAPKQPGFYPTDPSTGLPIGPTNPSQPPAADTATAEAGLTGTFRLILLRTLEIGAGLVLVFIGLSVLGRWLGASPVIRATLTR